jgi:hypothetical protein
VSEQLKNTSEILQPGIEILSLAILSLRPTPEMSKALEAEAREALNRKADDAVYARRNGAIEQERSIKENEFTFNSEPLLYRLSIETISAERKCRFSAIARFDPTNPAPPVTRILIELLPSLKLWDEARTVVFGEIRYPNTAQRKCLPGFWKCPIPGSGIAFLQGH